MIHGIDLIVISGGQTGVDQAALRAAAACNLTTGGTMPWGYMTENGSNLPLAVKYGLGQSKNASYMDRTRINVRMATATLILGKKSIGSSRTQDCARQVGKACLWINDEQIRSHDEASLEAVESFIKYGIMPSLEFILNVAGNRESVNPGIGAAAEGFLVKVFTMLKGF